MTDLIDRKAAIDEIRKCRFLVDAIEKIRELPSPQPDKDLIHLQKEQAYMQGYEDGRKSRTGKWLNRRLVYMDVHIATCDQCGKRVVVGDFCPNCGSYNGGTSE